VHRPEEELLAKLKSAGVDLLCTLPCDRVKRLIALADEDFFRLPLTREEEGVGISAGAALAGRRPAMILQSSGVGNMINALTSLTMFYELPLALFVSLRGVHREGIAAQIPMGRALPGLLAACGIGVTLLESPEQFGELPGRLEDLYARNRVHAFLLNPVLWEGSEVVVDEASRGCRCEPPRVPAERPNPAPELTRYEILKAVAPELSGALVVANLGVPSKELYDVLDQETNFYMLGSMGMATPIGLGLALSTDRRVIVIDGDGSLLMNPGTLATTALALPENLVIVAVDNGCYGSTGSQPTLTGSCVDLELVARGFGLTNVVKAARADSIRRAVREAGTGPAFIHVPARPGNAPVGNIPLGHLEIRDRFVRALRG